MFITILTANIICFSIAYKAQISIAKITIILNSIAILQSVLSNINFAKI